MVCDGISGGDAIGKAAELGGKIVKRLSDGAEAFAEAVEENIHTAAKGVKRNFENGGLARVAAKATENYVKDLKEDPLQTMLNGGFCGELGREIADHTKDNLKDIYKITIENNPTIKAGEAMVKGKPKK